MMVTSLRAIAMERGLVISASPQGKQKTLAQNIALFCLLWHYQLLWANTHRVGMVMLYVALICTYWSGGLYFWNFLRADHSNGPAPSPGQALPAPSVDGGSLSSPAVGDGRGDGQTALPAPSPAEGPSASA
jgi:hypothetical protein